MSKHNKRLGRACFGAAMIVGASQAAASTSVAGNVADWVAAAKPTGTAPDSQTVSIVVHMALKNTNALTRLAAAVSTPGTAQYGRYLTPAQVAERFAPDAADVASVTSLLGASGMTKLKVGPMGVYVAASATVGQLRQTFGVSQRLYRFGGTTLRANREAPTVPAALAGKILFIEGLDETGTLRQPFHHAATAGALVAPAAAKAAVTPPPIAANTPSPYCDTYYGDLKATLSTKPSPYSQSVPWLLCGYTPQQIQAAYGFDKVALDGSGITVGIIDAFASPTLKADGNRYAANHGLPPLTGANFSEVIPQGIYNVPANQVTNAYGWWGEQSLDLAAVHGSAPGAAIVYIGSTDNSTSLTIALIDSIYNKRADILTNSYGNNGESVPASDVAMEDQAFLVAEAEGVTLLFSSGDGGDLSQANGVASGAWEATSPYVTGVGGTSLGVTNAKGAKVEYGWGTYRDFLAGATVNSGTSITTSGLTTTTALGATFDAFSFYAGAGGGISLIEPQPDYQASVVPASLATSVNLASGNTVPISPHRVTPDVAMVADPYTGYLIGETFTIAGDGHSDIGCAAKTATTEYCEIPFGGTSLASPLMAGTMAVVDQARAMKGKPLVGFANPFFYGAKIGATNNSAGINQILPPAKPAAVLRGYVNNLNEVRVVTLNSVPFLIDTAPYPLQVCASTICEGVDEIFNYVTPGYNDVTGLGVPYLPALVKQ